VDDYNKDVAYNVISDGVYTIKRRGVCDT